MIRTLEVDGPDGLTIELNLNTDGLQWNCNQFPELADVANSLTISALLDYHTAYGYPDVIVFNTVAGVFAPGLEIVNDFVPDPDVQY